MLRANRAFAACHYHAALGHYDQALALVDDLIDCSRPCAGLLMAKIVSHHNRANALARAGLHTAADDDYSAAYAFARCVADDEHMPDGLRQAACRHRSACLAEWQEFQRARRIVDPAGVDPAGPATLHDDAAPCVVH